MLSLRRLLIDLYLRRFATPRDLARWAFRRHARRIAFHDADATRLTFAELGERVYALAAGFLARGLLPGDRIAFLLPNCLEFVIIRLACHEAGMVAVPLVGDLSPEARRDALKLTDARLYLFDPALDGGVALAVACEMPGLECIPVAESGRSTLDGLYRWGTGPCRIRIAPDAPASVHFTSGTTGISKGVISTQGAWMSSVRMIAASSLQPRQERLIMLHAIPFATAGWGPVLPCLLGGATGLLMRRFDAAKALELAEREGATHVFFTPSMLIDWLDDPSLGTRDLSALKVVIYGTASLHGPKAAEALARLGPKLQQGYGLAEVLPPLAILSAEEHDPKAHPFRAGRIAHGVEVRIVGADGREVPPGERGEVRVRSATRTLGYWQRPDLTAEAISNAFFHTGDIGCWDEAGFLSVIGRAAELVPGFPLHPREVEEIAHAHSALKECALVGIDGRAVLAYSVRRDRSLPEEELSVLLAERLRPEQRPARVVHCGVALPHSAAGKILRGAVERVMYHSFLVK